MKITYLGHSAFALEDGERLLLVDPFLTGNPKASANAEDFSPQVILLTHAHDDHLGDTIEIAKRAGSTVIATFELGEWLQAQGVEGAIDANHGGTVAFEGGTTKLFPAWHTSSYGTDWRAPGVPAGHVVRFGGQTIYFAGDTALFSDMKLVGDEGIDIAVLPIGDHYTMGPADAVRAAEFVGAPVVIPCHYNTFGRIEQDPKAFKVAVESKTNAKVVVLDPGESYTP